MTYRWSFFQSVPSSWRVFATLAKITWANRLSARLESDDVNVYLRESTIERSNKLNSLLRAASLEAARELGFNNNFLLQEVREDTSKAQGGKRSLPWQDRTLELP